MHCGIGGESESCHALGAAQANVLGTKTCKADALSYCIQPQPQVLRCIAFWSEILYLSQNLSPLQVGPCVYVKRLITPPPLSLSTQIAFTDIEKAHWINKVTAVPVHVNGDIILFRPFQRVQAERCFVYSDSPASMAVFWHVHGEASEREYSGYRSIIKSTSENIRLHQGPFWSEGKANEAWMKKADAVLCNGFFFSSDVR